jgi:hypothetical protein
LLCDVGRSAGRGARLVYVTASGVDGGEVGQELGGAWRWRRGNSSGRRWQADTRGTAVAVATLLTHGTAPGEPTDRAGGGR